MKARPILFSGDMVRAILDGRKTQTRRPLKVPKWVDGAEAQDFIDALNKHGGKCAKRGPCDGLRSYVGPLGSPGDELWVRETFQGRSPWWIDEVEGGTWGQHGATRKQALDFAFHYRADPENDYLQTRWTPSIHMPRWASRITLRLTGVRVERLRDITEDDARAEGFLNRAHFLTAFGAMYPAEPNPWVWALTFQAVKP